MKKSLILLGLLILSTQYVHADQYVNGYYRNDGTYVQGHYKTTPNCTLYDNYSTRGNQNPYTGQYGTVNPYRQHPYSSGGGLNLNTKSSGLRW